MAMTLSASNLFSLFHLSLLLITCLSTTLPPTSQPPMPKTPYYKSTPPPVNPPTPSPPTKPPTQPPSPPPTKPPVKPPSPPPTRKPPIKPPSPPPAKPPTQTPPTKPPSPSPVGKTRPCFLQGMVYCKSCGFWGINTLLRAKPLPGARVACKCRKGTRFAKKIAITNENGFFFMEITGLLKSFGVQNCRAFLASAPRKSGCRQHSNLNGGISGGVLNQNLSRQRLPFDLYTVGPFGFDPSKKFCKKHPHLVLD